MKVKDTLLEIQKLEEENKELKAQNEFLQKKYADLKKHYDDFYEKEYLARIDECNNLWGELFEIKHMTMWEFAAKYCSDEDMEQAGHQLARSLLGHRMTDEEVKIAETESRYDYYTGDDF